MTTESLRETLRRELPDWLRQDPELRAYILDLTRNEYANREETQDRFYELLTELRRDREEQRLNWQEQNRKWEEQNRHLEEQNGRLEEQNRKWEAQNGRWEEQSGMWKEQNSRWEEQSGMWKEQNSRWEEQNRKWEEQNRKWDKNQAEMSKEFKQLYDALIAQAAKQERGIGALGSRWGLQSEKAFRDALAGILEQSFGVEVINVNEYDDEGVVFGRPDQVELDVIIKNGLLIICELKSSIDKAGMYSFERKARFYEQRHQRQASRLIVISPMIDARARPVAERLGIETYGDSIDVETL
jgi:hypothetical protein|nr:DUF3782 domain-containing protein [uncultured Thiodictyon sp.]